MCALIRIALTPPVVRVQGPGLAAQTSTLNSGTSPLSPASCPCKPRLRRRSLCRIFLNARVLLAVFMIEAKRVVTGEAILSGVATIDRTNDGRSQIEEADAAV